MNTKAIIEAMAILYCGQIESCPDLNTHAFIGRAITYLKEQGGISDLQEAMLQTACSQTWIVSRVQGRTR